MALEQLRTFRVAAFSGRSHRGGETIGAVAHTFVLVMRSSPAAASDGDAAVRVQRCLRGQDHSRHLRRPVAKRATTPRWPRRRRCPCGPASAARSAARPGPGSVHLNRAARGWSRPRPRGRGCQRLTQQQCDVIRLDSLVTSRPLDRGTGKAGTSARLLRCMGGQSRPDKTIGRFASSSAIGYVGPVPVRCGGTLVTHPWGRVHAAVRQQWWGHPAEVKCVTEPSRDRPQAAVGDRSGQLN